MNAYMYMYVLYIVISLKHGLIFFFENFRLHVCNAILIVHIVY